MRDRIFLESDLNDTLIHFADKYLKKVIIHAKYHAYRDQAQRQKHGIVIVDLDNYPDELGYEDMGFEEAVCCCLDVRGVRIPVYNPDLAAALLALTETQRVVLIQNVCLGRTLKAIAEELDISERMAGKHKHNAIEFLRRRLKQHEE